MVFEKCLGLPIPDLSVCVQFWACKSLCVCVWGGGGGGRVYVCVCVWMVLEQYTKKLKYACLTEVEL